MEGMGQRGLDRRRFIGRAAALIGGATVGGSILAACGDDGDDGTTSAAAPATSQAAPPSSSAAATTEAAASSEAATTAAATTEAAATSEAAATTQAATNFSGDFVYWSWQPPDSPYGEIFDAAGERLTAANPDLSFKHTSVESANYFTKFQTAYNGDESPDCMEMFWTGQYVDLVQQGTLTDLTDQMSSLPAFYGPVLDSLKVDGKVYGVPIDLNTLTIAWNQKVFEDVGIQPPASLDELIDSAGKIRDKGYQPLAVNIKDGWPGGDLWFAQMAYVDPSGTAIREAEAGERGWDDPMFLQAAENVKRMVDAKLFADGSNALDFTSSVAVYGRGEVAMLYPVGNFSTQITADAVGDKFTWDLFPFPPLNAGDEVKATGGPAIIASVPTNAKLPEAGVEYIRLLTDAEGSAALIERDYIPAYDIDTSANTDPLYAKMVSFQPTAQTRAIFVPKVYDALVNGMQSLINGNGSPADVISGMVKAAA